MRTVLGECSIYSLHFDIPASFRCCKWLANLRTSLHLFRECLVESRALRFPGDHLIVCLPDNSGRITGHLTASRNFFVCLNKGARADNAFIAYYHVIHDNCVHAYE